MVKALALLLLVMMIGCAGSRSQAVPTDGWCLPEQDRRTDEWGARCVLTWRF